LRRSYRMTDAEILEKALVLGRGGSTAVTAILINGEKLVVANVGDSRAVICKNGVAKQLSVDHEPSREKRLIESRGGFVSNLPGSKLSELITKEKKSFSVFIWGRLK
jgi:protein phosphatase 1L